MAELLNTKINGTLNVNDYFNIDKNGNLTLKLKNETENRLIINSNGLILNTDFKMQSGTAFLNIINSENINGIDVQALLQINNKLKINSSASFISDAELTINNNITAKSLKIKYDDNNIILDANKDNGLKIYNNLTILDNDKITTLLKFDIDKKTLTSKNISTATADIETLNNSKKYLMNYKYTDIVIDAKSFYGTSIYEKYVIDKNDSYKFNKNDTIEIIYLKNSKEKKFLTTIYSKTYVKEKDYYIILVTSNPNDSASSSNIKIRKIYDYTMFDIQKNDSSIFNVTGEEVNINKPVAINNDTTIKTEYSGITINDTICDSLFNYTLTPKPDSPVENVSSDENWYLINTENNEYKEFDLGSQIKINNVIHNVEFRDVYFKFTNTFTYKEFGDFDKMNFSLSNNPTGSIGEVTVNTTGNITLIFEETELKRSTVMLTNLFKKRLNGDYVKVKGTSGYRDKNNIITNELLTGNNYFFSKFFEYSINTNKDMDFYSYKKYRAIIFKDDYIYSTGDKIYYKDIANSYNLLNINTRKSNNFLTIKTDNQINIDGKISAKELYDNGNRVYTPENLHLYETTFNIMAYKSNSNDTTALTYKKDGNAFTSDDAAEVLVKEVHLFAKKVLPYKINLTASDIGGFKFVKEGTTIPITPFNSFDVLGNSYLMDKNNNFKIINQIEINTYGIKKIMFENNKIENNLLKKGFITNEGYEIVYPDSNQTLLSDAIIPWGTAIINNDGAYSFSFKYKPTVNDITNGQTGTLGITDINKYEKINNFVTASTIKKMDYILKITINYNQII